ncbi:bacteriocin immunity protein [Dactylosporangium sp. NPDC006015]|uniref:bacteriocin immunity protein n=1 Tax=Dactylosporangium sp. NPDC006015 TaxID=3154576 RepID=UPI0033BC20B6
MELRPELREPEVPPELLTELCAAIEQIEDLHWRGEPTEAAIAAFNARTGSTLELYDFLSYHGSISTQDFARMATWPAWPKLIDITREELTEIVRRVLESDREHEYYLYLLKVNVVHPAPSDVIHHPPPHLGDDASPEAIVEEILKYRPIAL